MVGKKIRIAITLAHLPITACGKRATMYQTYNLQDRSGTAQLEVVPERGGIITRWQVRGQDILYLDAERFANPALSVRGGSPILFPICGNLPENLFSSGGGTYVLKQHGFARDLPWQVQSQTSDAITLTLSSNALTLSQYPFAFELQFTYRISSDRLSIHQRITNTGTMVMPFSIGFHPYFLVQDKTQLQFEIPATQMVNQMTQEALTFDGSFDWQQPELDIAFRPLTAQRAVAKDGGRKFAIALEFDSLYSTLVFWTIKGKDYYCLEPWSAPRNAINSGDNLTDLQPGAVLETVVTLTVSQG
jgi:galactose mutarotase-like enzyme